MNEEGNLKFYLIIVFFIWTLMIVSIVLWKINYNQSTTYELAEAQARASFNKDKAFRLWLTDHGRLYIPTSEKYQPDPYLSHIKDRDVVTTSGIHLSMINPARIIREIDEQYGEFYSAAASVTSLDPIRPENMPDEWEKNALIQLENGVKEVIEYTTINDQPVLRLIQPLPIKNGCLLCHLSLKNKPNDVGGGVTIVLPLSDLLKRENAANIKDTLLFIVVWLTGLVALIFIYRRMDKQFTENIKIMAQLTSSQMRHNAIMQSALDCIIAIDANGMVIDLNQATEQTFGYQRKEMLDKDLALLIIPEESREQHYAGMKRLIETNETKILNTRIEVTAQHADGHQFPIELAISQINDEGKIFFTAYLRDLTQAHQLKKELTYQARHDALTGLINRHAFEEHLKRLFDDIDTKKEHCLLYIDLDHFKIINDTCGHIAGDELLRQASFIMEDHKRSNDVLARLGGDEFALLLKNCPIDRAEFIAGSLVKAISSYRFYWEEKIFSIGMSIGIVPIQEHFTTQSEFISIADAACYKAKEEGRNRYFIYRYGDEELALRKVELDWISRINYALENDRFLLYKQGITPIKNLNNQHKLHCEILLRMKGDNNIIGPSQFIPAAERYNLMLNIDKWVINKTFAWLSKTSDLLALVDLCTINLSAYSVTNELFSQYIKEKIQFYKIPPQIICFEITETVAISNLIKAKQFMKDIHDFGCLFALDDFGSGMSSFSYLKNLPVDFLKIDGEFVKDIDSNPVNRAMVNSINEIGQIMGKKTIAEFVENHEVVKELNSIGVDFAQGYIFSRPSPID